MNGKGLKVRLLLHVDWMGLIMGGEFAAIVL